VAGSNPGKRHPVPASLAANPFTTTTALNVISRRQLQGRSYRRLMRGAHWVADEVVDHGRAIQAAMQILPTEAVLAGRSALWCYGLEVARPLEPVEVIIPPGARARSRAEIRVRRDALRPEESRLSPRGLVTTPARTAFDLGRSGPPLRTVPMLDALVRATEVPLSEVLAIRRSRPGARGSRLLDQALDLVDPGAESFPESRLRVTLVEAGLARPVCNHSIYDGARFVARVDLAWPHVRVAVEYDGAHHDNPTQIAADRRRLNTLRALGWTVLVIDRHQLRRPGDVVRLVSRVLRDASRPRSAQ
jgi:very-short-patch-repair endonuclease